jgi:preprotein translocase subunit SecA
MDVAKVVDNVIARFIGTKHERDIKKLEPLVAAINALEAELCGSDGGGTGGGSVDGGISDDELKNRFQALKTQVQEQLKDADPAEPTYCNVRWAKCWCRPLRWCARLGGAS